MTVSLAESFQSEGIYMRNLTGFFASSDVSASRLIIFGKGKYSGHMQINGEKKKKVRVQNLAI